MTPPIVYIIPPARSQLNAAFGSALIICVNARTQIQPMRIYNTEETHFGHEIFHLFVMAGSICHFIMMFKYVAIMPIL